MLHLVRWATYQSPTAVPARIQVVVAIRGSPCLARRRSRCLIQTMDSHLAMVEGPRVPPAGVDCAMGPLAVAGAFPWRLVHWVSLVQAVQLLAAAYPQQVLDQQAAGRRRIPRPYCREEEACPLGQGGPEPRFERALSSQACAEVRPPSARWLRGLPAWARRQPLARRRAVPARQSPGAPQQELVRSSVVPAAGYFCRPMRSPFPEHDRSEPAGSAKAATRKRHFDSRPAPNRQCPFAVRLAQRPASLAKRFSSVARKPAKLNSDWKSPLAIRRSPSRE